MGETITFSITKAAGRYVLPLLLDEYEKLDVVDDTNEYAEALNEVYSAMLEAMIEDDRKVYGVQHGSI